MKKVDSRRNDELYKEVVSRVNVCLLVFDGFLLLVMVVHGVEGCEL